MVQIPGADPRSRTWAGIGRRAVPVVPSTWLPPPARARHQTPMRLMLPRAESCRVCHCCSAHTCSSNTPPSSSPVPARLRSAPWHASSLSLCHLRPHCRIMRHRALGLTPRRRAPRDDEGEGLDFGRHGRYRVSICGGLHPQHFPVSIPGCRSRRRFTRNEHGTKSRLARTDSRTFLCPSRTVEANFTLDGDDGCNFRFLPPLSSPGKERPPRLEPSHLVPPILSGTPPSTHGLQTHSSRTPDLPQPQPDHPVVSGRGPTVCPVTFHIHRFQFTASRRERGMAGTGEAETGNPVGGRSESHRGGLSRLLSCDFLPGLVSGCVCWFCISGRGRVGLICRELFRVPVPLQERHAACPSLDVRGGARRRARELK